MKLNPYLHFNGNAEEAIQFYATALNGNVERLGRYGESPVEIDEDWKQKIIHGRLVFNDNVLMISDAFKGQPVSKGGNIMLNITVENTSQLETVFNNMAEGGQVTMALQDTFWGARFGMLKDKFDVHWMFTCELDK